MTSPGVLSRRFPIWHGASIPDTYGGKTVLNYHGEPVFAELFVLRMLERRGWCGVWVDSLGRKYRTGLPGVVDPVELPEDQARLLKTIRATWGGCWDVFAWKGDALLFVEVKRLKSDRVRPSQTEWVAEALKAGLQQGNFALVEWDLR